MRKPSPGASLLLSFSPSEISPSSSSEFSPLFDRLKKQRTRDVALIIGSSKLASTRALSALEAGYKVYVIGPQQLQQTTGEVEGDEFDWSGWDKDLQDLCLDGSTPRCQRISSFRTESLFPADEAFQEVETAIENLSSTYANYLFSLSFFNSLALVICVDSLPFAPSSLLRPYSRPFPSSVALSLACNKLRLPCNIADLPEWSDFSWCLVERWSILSSSSPSNGKLSDRDEMSPLQVAICTNRRGCRLAGRIRGEIVKALPSTIGNAVQAVGLLRDLAQEVSFEQQQSTCETTSNSTLSETAYVSNIESDVESKATSIVSEKSAVSKQPNSRPFQNHDADSESLLSAALSPPINSPVPQLSKRPTFSRENGQAPTISSIDPSHVENNEEDSSSLLRTRMRWISQVSEFWPLDSLARMAWDENERNRLLDALPISHAADDSVALPTNTTSLMHDLNPQQRRLQKDGGRIILMGSGPGSPGLLPQVSYRLLSSGTIDLLLSDKLVPAPVLNLVPKEGKGGREPTKVVIARKFPGNSEGAQDELMHLAVEAAREGKLVVRLKQGDPYIYGRGGEEVLHFREHGFDPIVIPGLSSALVGPLFAGIPVTQRGVSEGMVLCTGVGRGGKKVTLPGYLRERTTVMLMGVARIREIVQTMTSLQVRTASTNEDEKPTRTGSVDGAFYPLNLPIAIIERASLEDQRVLVTTLENAVEAVENLGEQRPPGMMIFGWSVLALDKEWEGDMTVLDKRSEEEDTQRVTRWLKGQKWRITEGLQEAWHSFLDESRIHL